MSLTKESLYWHGTYENMTQFQRRRVDNAYTKVRHEILEDSNVIPKNGDEAEELIAAITKYYVQSGGA